MAPIRTDGMAMIRQPSPPTNDRYLAVPTVLADRTLWKYTCQGSPPNMSRRKESMYTPTNTGSTSWIHMVEELTDMFSTKSFVKANGTHSHWNEKFGKCVKKYYRGRMYRLFLVRWFRCHCKIAATIRPLLLLCLKLLWQSLAIWSLNWCLLGETGKIKVPCYGCAFLKLNIW